MEFDPTRLIAQIAASQDRAAFAELFQHYAPRVKAMMMRRGASADRAEDMAQETLLRVHQANGRLRMLPPGAEPVCDAHASARLSFRCAASFMWRIRQTIRATPIFATCVKNSKAKLRIS